MQCNWRDECQCGARYKDGGQYRCLLPFALARQIFPLKPHVLSCSCRDTLIQTEPASTHAPAYTSVGHHARSVPSPRMAPEIGVPTSPPMDIQPNIIPRRVPTSDVLPNCATERGESERSGRVSNRAIVRTLNRPSSAPCSLLTASRQEGDVTARAVPEDDCKGQQCSQTCAQWEEEDEKGTDVQVWHDCIHPAKSIR